MSSFFFVFFFSCQFHTFESVEQQTDASEVTRLIHHVIGVSKKSSCFAQAVQSDVHLGCTDMTEKCFSFSDTALIHPPTNRRFFWVYAFGSLKGPFLFFFFFFCPSNSFSPEQHSRVWCACTLRMSLWGMRVHYRQHDLCTQ